MSNWATGSVLAWLSAVLSERFGHAVELERKEVGFIGLGLRETGACRLRIACQAGMFTRTDSDLPCGWWKPESEGWTSITGKDLPMPGVETPPSQLITLNEQGYQIHYDILGLMFWMLSRQEEVGRTDLDSHGRFPASSSHAYKHDYLERPVVDEWLMILGQVLQRAWPEIRLKQHKFRMKVSHDVDVPSLYAFKSLNRLLRICAGDLIRRKDPTRALMGAWIRMAPKDKLHAADPANTFNWLMDVSDQYGLRSAFYFICGRTDAAKDADYEPEHPAIRDLMRRIHARGHEIGLHPSYNTYQNPDAILEEAQRLRRICNEEQIEQREWGGRMHFLRWENPTTMRAWADASMTYDSTLGYADRPGFRCGTCFEYPAFDPVKGRMLSLRIRPLVAMECTVIAQRYLGLGLGEVARGKFEELKNASKAVNGTFTLLWHNALLSTPRERDLYTSIIES